MLDLFENPQLLRSSDLKLGELSLCGIPYGCDGSEFPVEQVIEVTLAPIVQSSTSSKEFGASYWNASGQTLSLSDVVANAIQFNGILHLPENVSFGFKDGRVNRFALYGTSLHVFRHIKSHIQFVEEFGVAGTVTPKEAFGDLMGYEHYYQRAQKFVDWDEMGKKIALINFGACHSAQPLEVLRSVVASI